MSSHLEVFPESVAAKQCSPKTNRIRIAVVGLGFGVHIVDALVCSPADRYFELVGVCDQDTERVRTVVAEYAIRAFATLDDLLADETIEAVGLFTGPIGRAALIRKIAEAGRHIMTTKPLELNADAALDALRFAKQQDCVVHLNSPMPVPAPDQIVISDWEQRYELGRPVACRRDVWVSYNESPNGSWYDDPDLCPAAPIFRLGIYLINDMVHAYGQAKQVTILQSSLRTKRGTSDNAQLGILFENGVIGNIFASFCVRDGAHYGNTLVANYEKGTIYGQVDRERTGYKLSLKQESEEGVSVTRAEAWPETRSGRYDWPLFAQAIHGVSIPNELTLEEMVYGIRIIEAMKEAVKNGGSAPVISHTFA